MLLIDALDFRGLYAESASGLYTIAWADNHGSRSGYRFEGKGRFALIRSGQILFLGESLERPQNGKVADDGTFILTDAFFGDSTTSMFLAFAPDGTELTRLSFGAKVFDTALSRDGRHAAIQLAGAKSEDANCLVFVDLAERRVAWKVTETAWADGYEFDAAGQRLRLLYADRAPKELTFNGKPI
ncbi:MAG: hypothetical protein NDI93_01990 [Pseudomonas sp.]|nr:hypothetical protein [Pseudomonas sp.]